MRILQLTNKVPFPPKDGGSIATLNLSKSFALLGCEVTILAINTSKHRVDIVAYPFRENDNKTKPSPLSTVHLLGVDVQTTINPVAGLANLFFSRLPYNAVRFISNHYKAVLTNLLRTSTFDVIQLEGLYLAPYIPLIRKHSNALIAMRSHNIEHEIWQRLTQRNAGLKQIYLNILTRRIKEMEVNSLKAYDLLVAITRRDANILTDLGFKGPVHVSPSGININELNQLDDQNVEYPSLFHLGALDWSPNQEGLLWFLTHCWAKINQRYPLLKFYIAGRNAPNWFINKLKQPNVVYCGEISDASSFIRAKAIMIVPLFSGSGMRIKIIEGMAYKKAIVTTTLGAEGIDCTDNVNILIADTPEKFEQQIEKLLQNEALVKNIGDEAYNFIVKNYDNMKIAQSLLEFFNENIGVKA